MRNYLLKTVFATFCFSLVFALFSCEGIMQKIDGGGYNSPDNESEQEFIISGTVSTDGKVSAEVGAGNPTSFDKRAVRTAVPTIPSSTTYKVTATESGGKSVQGEVDQAKNTFSIRLSSGTWTINVEVSSGSTKILEGSSGPITLNANSVNDDIKIQVSLVSDGNVNGNIDLTVNFDGATGISSVEMTLIKVGSTPITIQGTGFGATSVRLTKTDIAAGTYDAQLKFKSSSGELKYSAHEVINVSPNLTTNTWSGSAPYLSGTGTNKTFSITKTLTDTFSRKEFYVQGTSGTTYTPTKTASDNNTGTYFDPFATVQKAVDTINSINDGTSAYKIVVDGTVTITSATASSAVIIQPSKNLNLTIESLNAKATIRANSNDMRVFIVGNGGTPDIKPNVTMRNLIVTGGKNETGGGGGIKLEAGNLTLSNVDVTGNSTTYGSGGGIYVGAGSCTITINGGTISNNRAESNGGGICVESAGSTLKISGTTTISGNSLTDTAQQETGTAIFVGKGATAEISGNVSITTGIAQGGALPTVYLEKGQMGMSMTGGAGSSPIPDAVLKLGGAVQIGNGSGTGIKMEREFWKTNTANIKITSSLASEKTIAINIANITKDNSPNNYNNNYKDEPIIEAENYKDFNQADCDKFSIDNTISITYLPWPLYLSLDANNKQGKLKLKQ